MGILLAELAVLLVVLLILGASANAWDRNTYATRVPTVARNTGPPPEGGGGLLHNRVPGLRSQPQLSSRRAR